MGSLTRQGFKIKNELSRDDLHEKVVVNEKLLPSSRPDRVNFELEPCQHPSRRQKSQTQSPCK